MRDKSGRFSKAPKLKKLALETDIVDIFWMVKELKKDLKSQNDSMHAMCMTMENLKESLAEHRDGQAQLRGEVGERLRVIEGDIEKMQKVIGVLAKHSQISSGSSSNYGWEVLALLRET